MLIAATLFAVLGCYFTYKSWKLEKEELQYCKWAYNQSFENAVEINDLNKRLE